MIRDIRAASRIVDAWGAVLNLPQIIGGFVFIGRLEGQLTLAGVIYSMVVAARIHRRQPLSRLMGVCHAPWLVLAPLLALRCAQAPDWTAFRAWLLYVTGTMTISVVFDVIDVGRFSVPMPGLTRGTTRQGTLASEAVERRSTPGGDAREPTDQGYITLPAAAMMSADVGRVR